MSSDSTNPFESPQTKPATKSRRKEPFAAFFGKTVLTLLISAGVAFVAAIGFAVAYAIVGIFFSQPGY